MTDTMENTAPEAAEPVRVVVVEDDADFCESLAVFLEMAGMSVRAAGDIAGLEQALRDAPADIVVLDINLPGESGFAAVERLQLRGQAGVIMLTGRSALQDRLEGLSRGADHYLLKPVELTELELVIRNLHARLAPPPESARHWRLDSAGRTLTAPDGTPVPVNAAECSLLAGLMTIPRRPVNRSDLLSALKGDSGEAHEPHLEVLLFRLRRKVKGLCGLDLPVQSVRGIGYLFTAGAQVSAG
ncbi:response regulator transcription factor [Pseudoxanthobacter sp.]|uniref:response regulator transcription factor n=1 Tax=Pseudoxanthobacter sp. TaxID=1925742 RepID=UPI002FE25203